MMPARQAAQTAEDARLIGLQRQEESYVAEERARALGREQKALELAQAEAAKSRQADLDAQAARTARDLAERQAQTDAAARAAAELNARTATAGQAAAERAAADADAARSAAEAARAQAVAAQQAAEAQTRQAQGAAAQSEQDKTVLREQLRTQLNVILDTRETARGLIVNLSDVLFDTASSSLKPGAREKLARVSGILVSHDGLRLRSRVTRTASVRTPTIRGSLNGAPNRSARIWWIRSSQQARSAQPALAKASRSPPTTRRRDGSRIGGWSWSFPATSSADTEPRSPVDNVRRSQSFRAGCVRLYDPARTAPVQRGGRRRIGFRCTERHSVRVSTPLEAPSRCTGWCIAVPAAARGRSRPRPMLREPTDAVVRLTTFNDLRGPPSGIL